MVMHFVSVEQDGLEDAMVAVLALLEEQVHQHSKSSDLAVIAAENILECLPATHPLQQRTATVLTVINSSEPSPAAMQEVTKLIGEWKSFAEQHS